jgi:hypothetical protein
MFDRDDDEQQQAPEPLAWPPMAQEQQPPDPLDWMPAPEDMADDLKRRSQRNRRRKFADAARRRTTPR